MYFFEHDNQREKEISFYSLKTFQASLPSTCTLFYSFLSLSGHKGRKSVMICQPPFAWLLQDHRWGQECLDTHFNFNFGSPVSSSQCMSPEHCQIFVGSYSIVWIHTCWCQSACYFKYFSRIICWSNWLPLPFCNLASTYSIICLPEILTYQCGWGWCPKPKEVIRIYLLVNNAGWLWHELMSTY